MIAPHPVKRAVVIWLFCCCAMIFVMALLGAVTRLMQAGLSITDWNPVYGVLPPLNADAWSKAFDDYRAIPQYRLFNQGMTLDAFKEIYFWEWFHRLWGRLIGVVFGVPLLIFAYRRWLNRKLVYGLILILLLIGLQGFVGWFMVQSGLTGRTSVSPYRLALHLGFALALYAVILWTALTQSRAVDLDETMKPLARLHGWISLFFLAVTIIWGAFVAGLHAGEAYNTWPLMDGEVLPAAAFTILPKWHNMFENLALVQFIHRWIGPTTMLLIVTWMIHVRTQVGPSTKPWLYGLATMSVVQVCLGIGTLLSHAEIVIATCHQAGAITLLTLLLIVLRRVTPLR